MVPPKFTLLSEQWPTPLELDQMIPGQEDIDPGVGGNNDDEREEEDIAVVEGVVDVRPVVRDENKPCIVGKNLKNVKIKYINDYLYEVSSWLCGIYL